MDDFNQDLSFMQFANHALSPPALKDAFYHLQHRGGFNINIILYLLWLAKTRRGRLTKRQIKTLCSQIALWHQRVLSELKYTYALLADQNDPTSLKIKQELMIEIEKAHLIEQHMLSDSKVKSPHHRSIQQQFSDACASMIHYCEMKNDLLVDEDENAFLQLFHGVFDTIDRTEIDKKIKLICHPLKFPNEPVQMIWSEL